MNPIHPTRLRGFAAAVLFGWLFAVPAVASATYISDLTGDANTYWGSDDHGYQDRIGSELFEVRGLDVSFAGGFMDVRVDTNFKEGAAGAEHTRYGDLFISTDGWHPNGGGHYVDDNYWTGEASHGNGWEFVFDTSEDMLYGGDYTVILSQDAPPSVYNPSRYEVRDGQEVLRGSGGETLAGSTVDLSSTGYGGSLNYRVSLASLGVGGGDLIGLKWGPTCANDTVEGVVSYDVPEPAPAALLPLGLGVLLVASRARRRPGGEGRVAD